MQRLSQRGWVTCPGSHSKKVGGARLWTQVIRLQRLCFSLLPYKLPFSRHTWGNCGYQQNNKEQPNLKNKNKKPWCSIKISKGKCLEKIQSPFVSGHVIGRTPGTAPPSLWSSVTPSGIWGGDFLQGFFPSGVLFLHSNSAAHCKAGSLELPWNLGHTGWNVLLVFQQDLLPHRLPTYPAKRKPERLNPFIKGATLEKLGGCEALERQNQRQTLRKHFVKQKKNSIMLAIVLSTLQNVIDLEQREAVSVHVSMLKKQTQKGSQTNTQAICLSDNWHKNVAFPSPLELFGCFKKNPLS